MNSRNNSYRGFGFYLVLILIVVGVWYFLDGNTTTNSYTRAAFEKDIQSGDVTAIDIVQNREIPTGSVNLTFSDSTQKVLIVSDVNEIAAYLQEVAGWESVRELVANVNTRYQEACVKDEALKNLKDMLDGKTSVPSSEKSSEENTSESVSETVYDAESQADEA